MFKILRSPLDAWKWLGDHEVDLRELPVTVRQAPSRFDAFLLGVLSFVCIAAPLGAGYMSTVVEGEPLAMSLAFGTPFVLLGLGMIPFIALSLRSGRTVLFERDGVSVRGKWFRRREHWSAPYAEFRGVDWMTEQVWTGRSTRTFHVVQLRHRDREKTIPLYVEAPIIGVIDDEDLARKAKAYATGLGVPALGKSRR